MQESHSIDTEDNSFLIQHPSILCGFTFTFIHLADAFIQSDLQLLYMSTGVIQIHNLKLNRDRSKL